MNKSLIYIFCLLLMTATAFQQEKPLLYQTTTGEVNFKSTAPLEVIEATSNELKGVIDAGNNTFAFSILITTFEGFNSPLQKEHFNENYMESRRYPKATYEGKIIEDLDLTKDGEYSIRTKGTLTIHGVEQERIIKSNVTVEDGKVRVSATFTIPLKEHDINVPKIVNQKIAEEILVNVHAEFTKRDA